MKAKPKRILHIYLKGGGQLAVPVESWKYKKDSFGKTLEWERDPNSNQRLVSLDLDEIAAIVEETP